MGSEMCIRDRYGPNPAYPATEVTDPILTILPYPRSVIPLAISLARKKAPLRFVSTTVSQSCQVTSRAGFLILQPALLIKMLIGPSSVSAFFTAFIILSCLVWSFLNLKYNSNSLQNIKECLSYVNRLNYKEIVKQQQELYKEAYVFN